MVDENLLEEDEIRTAETIEEEYDSSNKDHVKQKSKQDKAKQRLSDEGFKELISDPKSRAWLWNILEKTNIFSSTFSVENSAMSFNEGRRSIGLAIVADLQRISPEMFSLMMRENKEKAYG